MIFPPFDGCALCSTTCRLNHSNEPNLKLTFPQDLGTISIIGTAIRPVQVGEEICFSYLPVNVENPDQHLKEYGII